MFPDRGPGLGLLWLRLYLAAALCAPGYSGLRGSVAAGRGGAAAGTSASPERVSGGLDGRG